MKLMRTSEAQSMNVLVNQEDNESNYSTCIYNMKPIGGYTYGRMDGCVHKCIYNRREAAS